jgi:hypothetical protein
MLTKLFDDFAWDAKKVEAALKSRLGAGRA